jgi:hypothetical protein
MAGATQSCQGSTGVEFRRCGRDINFVQGLVRIMSWGLFADSVFGAVAALWLMIDVVR